MTVVVDANLLVAQVAPLAYLATAEHLGADFWTADRRLARHAKQLGIGWVRAVQGEEE